MRTTLHREESNTKFVLTYFQPRVVLQHSQNMSATAWRPVNNTLSSAGPHPTFTLKRRKFTFNFTSVHIGSPVGL